MSLGDVGGHVAVLLYEEWIGRRTRPIHHEKVVVSRKNERTKPKLPFPKIVDVTSMIPRDVTIGELVPGIVSHTYK